MDKVPNSHVPARINSRRQEAPDQRNNKSSSTDSDGDQLVIVVDEDIEEVFIDLATSTPTRSEATQTSPVAARNTANPPNPTLPKPPPLIFMGRHPLPAVVTCAPPVYQGGHVTARSTAALPNQNGANDMTARFPRIPSPIFHFPNATTAPSVFQGGLLTTRTTAYGNGIYDLTASMFANSANAMNPSILHHPSVLVPELHLPRLMQPYGSEQSTSMVPHPYPPQPSVPMAYPYVKRESTTLVYQNLQHGPLPSSTFAPSSVSSPVLSQGSEPSFTKKRIPRKTPTPLYPENAPNPPNARVQTSTVSTMIRPMGFYRTRDEPVVCQAQNVRMLATPVRDDEEPIILDDNSDVQPTTTLPGPTPTTSMDNIILRRQLQEISTPALSVSQGGPDCTTRAAVSNQNEDCNVTSHIRLPTPILQLMHVSTQHPMPATATTASSVNQGSRESTRTSAVLPNQSGGYEMTAHFQLPGPILQPNTRLLYPPTRQINMGSQLLSRQLLGIPVTSTVTTAAPTAPSEQQGGRDSTRVTAAIPYQNNSMIHDMTASIFANSGITVNPQVYENHPGPALHQPRLVSPQSSQVHPSMVHPHPYAPQASVSIPLLPPISAASAAGNTQANAAPKRRRRANRKNSTPYERQQSGPIQPGPSTMRMSQENGVFQRAEPEVPHSNGQAHQVPVDNQQGNTVRGNLIDHLTRQQPLGFVCRMCKKRFEDVDPTIITYCSDCVFPYRVR